MELPICSNPYCGKYIYYCKKCGKSHCQNERCWFSSCPLPFPKIQIERVDNGCGKCRAPLRFCSRCEEIHCTDRDCCNCSTYSDGRVYRFRPCWTMGGDTGFVTVPSPEKELKTEDPSTYQPVMRSFQQRLQEKVEEKSGKRKREEEKTEDKPKASLARQGNEQAFNTFQAPGIDVGVATWNINHTGEKSNPEHKAACIRWLFNKHEWLDVLVLQEVNSTMPDINDEALTVKKGPLMLSMSSAAEPENMEDKRYEYFLDSYVWGYVGQREHYVAVFRNTVEHLGVRVFYKGQLSSVYDDPLRWGKVESDKDLEKKEKKYGSSFKSFPWSEEYQPSRPVVVHDFQMRKPIFSFMPQSENTDHLRFSVAIIHTTPEGAGMGRKGEFEQVRDFLVAADKNIHWIIAGDYYLDEDASVTTNSDTTSRPMKDKFGTRIEEMGLKMVTSVSATNQSPSKMSELPTRKKKKKGLEFASQETLKELHELDKKMRNQEIERQKAKAQSPLLVDRLSDRVLLEKDGLIRPVVNKIADFFVCTPGFLFAQAGVVRPKGGVLPVDPNHNALNWWGRTSDHMPVGGVFSTQSRSTKWVLASAMPIDRQRELRAQDQLDDIVRSAVYEISGSLNTLCRNLMATKAPWDPVFTKALLFWDRLLSDPYLKLMGAMRPDLPRDQMQQFCASVSDGKLIDYLAFWTNVKIGKPTSDDVEKNIVVAPRNGINEEIHNICIHLPRLWLSIDDFDLTPESETYEDVTI